MADYGQMVNNADAIFGLVASKYEASEENARLRAELDRLRSHTVDTLLWCPNCGAQHVDAPEGDWTNPPHKSHLCHGCGLIWRPSDIPTNGVAKIESRGSADTWDGQHTHSASQRRVEQLEAAYELPNLCGIQTGDMGYGAQAAIMIWFRTAMDAEKFRMAYLRDRKQVAAKREIDR